MPGPTPQSHRRTDRRLLLFGVVAAAAMLAVTWTPLFDGASGDPSRPVSPWSIFGSDALLATSALAAAIMVFTFLRTGWPIWLNRLAAAAVMAILGTVAGHHAFGIDGLFADHIVYWAVYPPLALMAAMQILAGHEKILAARAAPGPGAVTAPA